MSLMSLLVYLHILLMVFWIGTDIGVFIAGRRFMDANRPLAERAAVLDLGMVIDRFPRICYVAIVPVGLQLVYLMGLMPVLSPRFVAIAWIVSAAWMAVVIMVMVQHGKPGARVWQRLERAFQVLALVVFAGLAVAVLFGRLEAPSWLAGKFLGYAGICLAAILLERAFGPVAGTFSAIARDGSTPDLESKLRGQMGWTYVWVIAIYAGVLVCGFLGTVKP